MPACSLTNNRKSTASMRMDSQDHGRAAWTVLAAVSITNIFTYGFTATFGVFRDHYYRMPGPFKGSQEVIYVGTISLGLIQGLTPFIIYICNKRPQHASLILWLGSILMVASTIGAAFAATPLQLVFTLGMVYGIGGSCVFAPCIAYIDDWFSKRRALANGIFFSLSSLAPACMSPIFSKTLERFGPRSTLFGWAIAITALSLLSLPFVRGRRDGHHISYKAESSNPSEHVLEAPEPGVDHLNGETIDGGRSRPSQTIAFWKQPLFYLFTFTTGIQCLGYFLPALYMPSFASDLGISTTLGSLLITFFQLVCVISQPLYGTMVDRIGPLIPLFVSTMLASIAILTLWGFAHSYGMLVALMILYGASAGTFVVFRSSFATHISLVSGILMAIRGVAVVVSGLAGRAVVQAGQDVPVGKGYGADRWKNLIIFVGVTMAATGLGCVGLLDRSRSSEAEAEVGVVAEESSELKN
ncbi:MFS general substrate transporter [Byssothecium circinans]|uniref:MFS general substrate transporter n=1 Tax=Byssothecium circinans TaxID=147558 RepID=A0A6A5TSY7_9PLEO|nr:MFS general substrate transporter [Byssothecium circinans]